MQTKLGICAVAAVAGMYALASPAMAAQTSLISGKISDSNLVTLAHNTRAEATKANDRGAIAGSKQFDGLELVLRRPAASERAFENVISQLHNPKSASFHHWLTNAEIGERFGASLEDVSKIRAWLVSHGMSVSGVSPDRTYMVFSGSADKLTATFHTEIHNLKVNGVAHYANMSDPKIPAALSLAVAGVSQLHNFYPHPTRVARFMPKHGKKPNYSLASGCFPANPTTHSGSFTNECEFVTPADLATIYDMKPAFNAGITGKGQSIVVLEDTYVYKQADWNIFRAVMGLSGYKDATFIQESPSSTAYKCTAPGAVEGNDGEAILDADYASASAPDANIILAGCADGTNFGGTIALENILQQAGHPNIVSMSYGECETENGATQNALFNSVAQSAAAEGVSLYVSAGDESATSCDANLYAATHGVGVSGFASPAYDIAVGGTDFTDNSNSSNSNLWKTYWNASNGTGYGSAKSYIPEQPWNDSCASEINAAFYTGSTLTYGSAGWCNDADILGGSDTTDLVEEFWSTGSGSGGPSGCGTGKSSKTGIVGGTCAGWAKPDYQGGTVGSNVIAPFAGELADGVRDMPDVSLFAANGLWGHYYPYCDSDPEGTVNAAGTAYVPGCTGADPANWAGAGGTSFSSPIFAGIQALINQKTGQAWGNTNEQYYAIAKAEYGASGNPTCDSSTGSGAGCAFHDVTAGDYNVNCGFTVNASTGNITFTSTAPNCYKGNSTYVGVGSYSGTNTPAGYIAAVSSYKPLFKSSTGWDFTTGLGTPDVNNLINAFPGGSATPTVKKKI